MDLVLEILVSAALALPLAYIAARIARRLIGR